MRASRSNCVRHFPHSLVCVCHMRATASGPACLKYSTCLTCWSKWRSRVVQQATVDLVIRALPRASIELTFMLERGSEDARPESSDGLQRSPFLGSNPQGTQVATQQPGNKQPCAGALLRVVTPATQGFPLAMFASVVAGLTRHRMVSR